MTGRGEASSRSPLALRLIHAAVFLAFAAGVMAAAAPDWEHGAAALGRPYHVGTPPRLLLVLGSVLAGTGALALVVALIRGRSAPLAASWLILGGLGSTVLGAAGGPPPERPSEPAFNTTLLQLGQRVQLAMVGQLQERGEVPVAREPWQAALEWAAPARSWVRTRTFQPVPPQVVWVASPEARPEPLRPASLLVHVSPDGAAFEIRLVGLEDGQPGVLKDGSGAPLVLHGLYNPDLPGRADPPR